MLKKVNCRGVSLIELLVTIAIISIISPIVFMIFVNGLRNFAGGTNYIDQQYKIQEVIASIREDVQKAKKVEFIGVRDRKDPLVICESVEFNFSDDESETNTRTWKFNDNKLMLKINNGEYITVVRDIDSDKSYFAYYSDGRDAVEQLVLGIMPLNNDRILNKGSNVQELITTEFSVRYKRVGEIE